jgi:hypothetical protein
MTDLRIKAVALLADPRSARLVLFGLTLVALLASLGAPQAVAACAPLGDSGSGGCAPF